MALLEYHRHEDTGVSVTFSGPVAALLGIEQFSGSVADLKAVLKLLAKKDTAPGDPIELGLFRPPAEEEDDAS